MFFIIGKVTTRRISFEYALAKDNNDNLEDAKELVKLLKGMLCHVNLIPINKIEDGKYIKSTNENIIKFRDYLNEKAGKVIDKENTYFNIKLEDDIEIEEGKTYLAYLHYIEKYDKYV